MKNKIILTGAGFSKSFGGWLTSEFTQYFVNEISRNKEISDRIRIEILGNLHHNFEEIYSKYEENQALAPILEKILIEKFELMRSFMSIDNQDYPQIFVNKFDAIFTLNQDAFLQSNGLEQMNKPLNLLQNFGQTVDKKNYFNHSPEIQIQSARNGICNNSKPVFELHGAYDWRDENGKLIMVFGSEDKENKIKQFPKLKEYHDEFKKRLNGTNIKLVIIGYSFQDEHINNIIQEATESGNLEIFVWDNSLEIIQGIRGDDIKPYQYWLHKSLKGYLYKPFSTKNQYDISEVDKFLGNI